MYNIYLFNLLIKLNSIYKFTNIYYLFIISSKY